MFSLLLGLIFLKTQGKATSDLPLRLYAYIRPIIPRRISWSSFLLLSSLPRLLFGGFRRQLFSGCLLAAASFRRRRQPFMRWFSLPRALFGGFAVSLFSGGFLCRGLLCILLLRFFFGYLSRVFNSFERLANNEVFCDAVGQVVGLDLVNSAP